ncbi:OLC1v1039190C1 [Oldenlandia corymbosa var. corymbosa]|uniref:methenyltetrahydrofolate cyclohydrolase n=1 Tax=Oldenlandia corymbosa var. corymbosa TaxID=529605 RepID=A0AAV1D1K1_OLDCO|nr:OLC1v1039190C1 [Oldenlandia corymbosa var. corymbosa]
MAGIALSTTHNFKPGSFHVDRGLHFEFGSHNNPAFCWRTSSFSTAAAKASEASVRVINGNSIADDITLEVAAEVSRMKTKTGAVPGLAFILVGNGKGEPLFVPCCPKGCLELLHRNGVAIEGKRAVVIDMSKGTQVAQLLQRKHATVTVVHSGTMNPEEFTREADIIIHAVGKRTVVNSSWIKPGAVVIDLGTNYVPSLTMEGEDFYIRTESCDDDSIHEEEVPDFAVEVAALDGNMNADEIEVIGDVIMFLHQLLVTMDRWLYTMIKILILQEDSRIGLTNGFGVLKEKAQGVPNLGYIITNARNKVAAHEHSK